MIVFALTVKAKAQQGFGTTRLWLFKKTLFVWKNSALSTRILCMLRVSLSIQWLSQTGSCENSWGSQADQTAYHSEKKTRKQRLIANPFKKIIGFSQELQLFAVFFFLNYIDRLQILRHLHIFTCLPGHSFRHLCKKPSVSNHGFSLQRTS